MNEEKRQPKTKEELEALQKEITDLYKKIAELTEDERKEIGICPLDPNELTDDELEQVSGGMKTNYKITLAAIIGLAPAALQASSFRPLIPQRIVPAINLTHRSFQFTVFSCGKHCA